MEAERLSDLSDRAVLRHEPLKQNRIVGRGSSDITAFAVAVLAAASDLGNFATAAPDLNPRITGALV